MAIEKSSVFLEIIEELSKSKLLSEGDIEGMSKEILYKAAHFLKINRANAWEMSDDGTSLKCIIAFDRAKDNFYSEGVLKAEDFPVYFNHINRSDIIISSDARQEPFNAELVENYLIPNNVYSMMEVPILSSGKMKGIICFENTAEIRNWSNDEQHFALALTQLLTMTLETAVKNNYRDELESLVEEKSVLLSEINHRVKNNLAVITALIRAESNRVKDEYHKVLFDNLLSKAFTLSTLQNSIYQSKDYQNVNFSSYLHTLISNMLDTYGAEKNVELDLQLNNIKIEMEKSIPCSLIINELLTNCFKYAFFEGLKNKLIVKLNQDENTIISIEDNGPGLPENYLTKGSGYDLIEGLVEQIDGNLEVKSDKNGTILTLTF